jgi:hypothetical protein
MAHARFIVAVERTVVSADFDWSLKSRLLSRIRDVEPRKLLGSEIRAASAVKAPELSRHADDQLFIRNFPQNNKARTSEPLSRRRASSATPPDSIPTLVYRSLLRSDFSQPRRVRFL